MIETALREARIGVEHAVDRVDERIEDVATRRGDQRRLRRERFEVGLDLLDPTADLLREQLERIGIRREHEQREDLVRFDRAACVEIEGEWKRRAWPRRTLRERGTRRIGAQVDREMCRSVRHVDERCSPDVDTRMKHRVRVATRIVAARHAEGSERRDSHVLVVERLHERAHAGHAAHADQRFECGRTHLGVRVIDQREHATEIRRATRQRPQRQCAQRCGRRVTGPEIEIAHGSHCRAEQNQPDVARRRRRRIDRSSQVARHAGAAHRARMRVRQIRRDRPDRSRCPVPRCQHSWEHWHAGS